MNPGCIVKFRPIGPWRIGPDSGARDRVDTIYHSDSLYSAVTGAMASLDRLAEWLDATARNPAGAEVRFSSCFPFQGDTAFIVPPKSTRCDYNDLGGLACIRPIARARRTGCRPNLATGEGVDSIAFKGVKHVVDLTITPWPWADSSVDEAHASHSYIAPPRARQRWSYNTQEDSHGTNIERNIEAQHAHQPGILPRQRRQPLHKLAIQQRERWSGTLTA